MTLVSGCSDLPRDNLLDPKNEDSYSESPVLIEAFVNTAYTEVNYNFWSLEALNDIEAFYQERVLIVEYHRDIRAGDSTYRDPFSNSKYDDLQQEYVNAAGSAPRALPDIYLNGDRGRVLGASSAVSVYNRLSPLLAELADEKSEYTLEIDLNTTGNNINIHYRLARLGNRAATDLRLNLIFVKDHGSEYSKRVVQKVNFPFAEEIDNIEAGEFFEDKIIETIGSENKPDYIIFTITHKEDVTILKTLKKVIPW